MSEKEVNYKEVAQLVVGKALLDPKFLERLRVDPTGTLAEIGVDDPPPQMINAIKSMDKSLTDLTEIFDEEALVG